MEFTAEQQAEIKRQIDEAVANATANMYSQDEFDRKLQAEVDRRVETGIQKGIETKRKKWEEEYKANANLTAEQLAEKKVNEQLENLSKREQELARKANRIEAMSKLSEADVPKTYYEKLLDNVISSDETVTMQNVETLIDTYSSTKKSLEEAIRSELSKVTPPPAGKGGGTEVTKEKFNQMSFAEKAQFKAENPEKFKEFIK